MKKVFVKTNNVKRFITMVNNLQNRPEGVPAMGLVYGEPGLGKTQTINWWAFKNDAILIRCTQLMTAKWLLNEILDYMTEIKPYYTSDCKKTWTFKYDNNSKDILAYYSGTRKSRCRFGNAFIIRIKLNY